jgi:catechol-2,3-dioxygenase
MSSPASRSSEAGLAACSLLAHIPSMEQEIDCKLQSNSSQAQEHSEKEIAMDNISVLGIEEIAFEVKDLDRSVAFYQNVIGLPLYSRGPQQAWFRVGQQSLALFTTDRAGSGQHFAFLIPHERAEQARRALVAQGFPEETMQQDDGLSVYVRDPDGNKIELYGKRSNA